ncbi:hypothetical protein BCR44DRAFT_1060968 [Catenaria anguillulae PL171]|uniref:Uncharacterized protein n=1 Tax=Catenaria anguillulae PL171 TaxID=765915 RepID=A0A1Y2HQF6_9FUNG|nr:hypothetical protein BCR44DRAFT_1060968 [Catenaria anguillulae PL171]
MSHEIRGTCQSWPGSCPQTRRAWAAATARAATSPWAPVTTRSAQIPSTTPRPQTLPKAADLTTQPRWCPTRRSPTTHPTPLSAASHLPLQVEQQMNSPTQRAGPRHQSPALWQWPIHAPRPMHDPMRPSWHQTASRAPTAARCVDRSLPVPSRSSSCPPPSRSAAGRVPRA